MNYWITLNYYFYHKDKAYDYEYEIEIKTKDINEYIELMLKPLSEKERKFFEKCGIELEYLDAGDEYEIANDSGFITFLEDKYREEAEEKFNDWWCR